MTRKELKKMLTVYPKIRRAVQEEKPYTVIERYGRKQRIELPHWLQGVEKSVETILQIGDEVVRTILDRAYLKGDNDAHIFMRMPTSESGYYRIKKAIVTQIYELCIAYGYVTETDIMQNRLG